MKTKKNLTLIVDGNWLCKSRAFLLKDAFDNNVSDYTQANNQLKSVLSASLSMMLQWCPLISNIIVVSDGGSWRKRIPRPVEMNGAYKSNRVTRDNVNWTQIFTCFNEWLQHIASLGITCSTSRDAEGDDWISYWTQRLNDENRNVLIWSTDADLRQLVSVRKNGTFTAWYEKRAGVFLHNEFDNADLLPLLTIGGETLAIPENNNVTWLKNKCERVTYIKPFDIVSQKVICGDAGDNIKSIYTWTSKSRTYRISEKMWQMIRSQYLNDVPMYNEQTFIDAKSRIIDAICKYKNIIDVRERELMYERFDYNVKMVSLSRDVVPQTLFENAEFKEFDVSTIAFNHEVTSDVMDETFANVNLNDVPF